MLQCYFDHQPPRSLDPATAQVFGDRVSRGEMGDCSPEPSPEDVLDEDCGPDVQSIHDGLNRLSMTLTPEASPPSALPGQRPSPPNRTPPTPWTPSRSGESQQITCNYYFGFAACMHGNLLTI